MHIIITRPVKKALHTQKKIKKMGHTPIMMPLSYFTYDREAVSLALQESYGGIAITSSESLSTLPDKVCHNSILFSIGEASASLARTKGFSQIFCGKNNSISLAQLIVQKKELFTPQKPLLYLGGKKRNIHFENYLFQHSIPFKTIDCYYSWNIVYSKNEVERIIKRADAVLFYASSSVSIFFLLPLPIKISVRFLCLSKNIASEIPVSFTNLVSVAEFPKESSLLELLLSLQSQKP
ncbi:Uroporphyrinogen-III synthase [Candidatus Liberibacter solanacearum]|uniref:uroporphyrinogen-III synthase n=1 Tax=Candidatus Liberibacter solanacearum TaxID=556287 RepID=UPI003871A9E3